MELREIGCSATNNESCVLPISISKAWEGLRWLKIDKMVPKFCSSCEWIDGEAGRVDSTIKISLKNTTEWFWRITEISEVNHSIGYEVIETKPPSTVTSAVG